MHSIQKIKAFTLVELSIVIVIIGLIIGGVTAGMSLVKQAKLRSVITEANTYSSAIASFVLQYGALPGDMRNSSSYWPSCASPATLCNGNGNGYVEFAGNYEVYGAWKTLSLAGMIPAQFTLTATNQGTFNVNTPESKFPAGGWFIRGNDSWYMINLDSLIGKRNQLAIGAWRLNLMPNSALFTPAQALTLDQKVDDGRPYGGQVKGMGGWIQGLGNHSANCASGSGAAATYTVSITTAECFMMFPIAGTSK